MIRRGGLIYAAGWLFAITIQLCALTAYAQTFEVASVKPSGPQSGNRIQGGPGSSDPIRYRYTSATLKDLIVTAYDIKYFQVASKTPVDQDLYDVEAKIPPGATKQEFRVMLQNLLLDRFQLKLHRERREFPGYALVVADSGLKLNDRRTGASGDKPPSDGFPEIPPGKFGIRSIETPENGHMLVRVRVQQMPMSDVARAIHVPGNAPVVDETGLSGKFDFTFEYSYPMAETQQEPIELPPAPTISTALRSQAGLRLISKRLPFDVLVIDSFSRVPTEN